MKPIRTIFTLSLLFFLAIPQGIFTNAENKADTLTPVFQSGAVKVVTASVAASVIVKPQTVPVVLPQASLVMSCNLSAASGAFSLQAGAQINLNQPANCFSLSAGALTLPQIHLAIRNNLAVARQVVVVQTAAWTQNALHQSGASGTLPAIPVTAFAWAMLFSIILVLRPRTLLKVTNAGQDFYKNLSLHQLQVLRC